MTTKEMPSPTDEQRRSAEFEAVWQAIKSWDVNVPEFYDGYCEANGSHATLILDALAEAEPTSREVKALGWLSAHFAALADAWNGNAPAWFPEPPEWLELWEKALEATADA